MPAGRLRSTVAIERQVKVSDGYGGYIVTWTQISTVPAQIVPVRSSGRGIDGVSGGGIVSMPHVEVHMRHSDDLADLLANATGYRLRNPETNEIYGVNAAQDFAGRRAMITVTATKGEPT